MYRLSSKLNKSTNLFVLLPQFLDNMLDFMYMDKNN